MIHHPGGQRNDNPEKRDEDDAEANVIQIVTRQDRLRHQKFSIGRLCFQFYMIVVASVKITN